MKNFAVLYYLIIPFLFATLNAKSSTDIDPVVEIMESYVSFINSLEKDGSAANVLDLYSEQYSGNTTYVKLSGAIVKKSYSKESIKSQLNDILEDENYNLKIKTNKILYSAQKEKAGTISTLLDFESMIDNKVAEKGTILMNIVISLQKGEWKIIQNNMVRVSETKDIGDCVCHIFEKGSTQFVTELYYPDGVEYAHKFDTFRIMPGEKDRSIKSGGKTFVWENSNNTLILGQKELGTATTPKQVIQLLIKKMNTESCANIIFR